MASSAALQGSDQWVLRLSPWAGVGVSITATTGAVDFEITLGGTSMNEKMVVDVLRPGERKELLLKNEKGDERTFYPHSNNVWFDVDEAKVAWAPERGEGLLMQAYVRGFVSLDRDRDLSVLGDPANTVKRFMVTIRGSGNDALHNFVDSNGEKPTEVVGVCMLGFNRADWEFGTESAFWLDVTLKQDSLDAMVRLLEAGQLTAAQFCARFHGLYSDSHPLEPITARAHLFLPPDKHNSIESPDLAHGVLSAFYLEGVGAQLKRASRLGEDAEEEPLAVQQGSAMAPSAQLTPPQDLGAKIEALRGTVKWVGGLLFVAMLMLVFK